MSIGPRIRKARQALGLTQETAAYRLAVSTQAVSQWERGATKPSSDKIAAIARTLGVTVDWLMRPDDETGASSSGPIEQHRVRAPFISDLPEDWMENPHLQFAKFEENGIEVTLKILGDVFALRIEDDMMMPEFGPGDIVIFDTGLAPQEGDFVFCAGEVGWDFLQYRGEKTNNGKTVQWFVPLNPAYLPFNAEPNQHVRIIGTAVEHRRFRRRDSSSLGLQQIDPFSPLFAWGDT